MLSWRDFGWRYVTRRAWALRDFSLSINSGERILLLAPSGAGKSTLMRSVAGLLQPPGDFEGSFECASNAPVGYLYQTPEHGTVMGTVGADIAFGLENAGFPADVIRHRVEAALVEVGLELPWEYPVRELSGGQRQRVALAAALAGDPDVLLLDEPLSMIDPTSAHELRALIMSTVEARGATMVLADHRFAGWLPSLTRIVILDEEGSLVADGTPAEVLAQHSETIEKLGAWLPDLDEPTGDPMSQQPNEPMPSSSARGRVVSLLTAEDLTLRPGVQLIRRSRRPRAASVDSVLAAASVRSSIQVPGALELREGEVTYLVGSNGSGKTTVAHALAGLMAPVGGSLRFDAQLSPRKVTEPHRWKAREIPSRIGLCMQNPEHQFVTISTQDEVERGPLSSGWSRSEAAARSTQLLADFGLLALAAANPFTLSGGQQRRLAIACAMAAKPAVLIMDEPTLGHDRLTFLKVLAAFSEALDSGMALVVCTHDEELMRELPGQVVSLDAMAAQPLALQELT